MPDIQPYAVYALKYAERVGTRNEIVLHHDAHEGPAPMDYFIWAIVGNGRTIVVDIGFEAEQARQRNRTLLRTPGEALKLININSEEVEDVVVTHLHYDHSGCTSEFPKARFYLQDREMAFATGRNMTHAAFKHAFAVDYVVDFVRKVFDDRVVFVNGDKELAPGVSVHHVGGHTDGLQFVRVWTKRGWVVLASDASHYYENMEQANPFPLVYNVGDMLEGYEKMRSLAASPDHVIPGHDPLVLQRYPAPSAETKGTVVCLDEEPVMDA